MSIYCFHYICRQWSRWNRVTYGCLGCCTQTDSESWVLVTKNAMRSFGFDIYWIPTGSSVWNWNAEFIKFVSDWHQASKILVHVLKRNTVNCAGDCVDLTLQGPHSRVSRKHENGGWFIVSSSGPKKQFLTISNDENDMSSHRQSNFTNVAVNHIFKLGLGIQLVFKSPCCLLTCHNFALVYTGNSSVNEEGSPW